MIFKVYDITSSDIGVGYPERIVVSSTREAYSIAYGRVRYAYKRNENLDLLLLGENNFSMILSSIPNLGILIGSMGSKRSSTWAKEEI